MDFNIYFAVLVLINEREKLTTGLHSSISLFINIYFNLLQIMV